jgi:hypothetical protein
MKVRGGEGVMVRVRQEQGMPATCLGKMVAGSTLSVNVIMAEEKTS